MVILVVLSAMAGAPLVVFGSRFLMALSLVGVANASLNCTTISNHLGLHAFSRMGKLRIFQYHADLEERYGMLALITDTNVNLPWTQTCITQADYILLVRLAEVSTVMGV